MLKQTSIPATMALAVALGLGGMASVQAQDTQPPMPENEALPPPDEAMPPEAAPPVETPAPAPEDANRGSLSPPDFDSDGDGTMDAWDRDGNGKADLWDRDGDGMPDAIDEDGDGEPDRMRELPADNIPSEDDTMDVETSEDEVEPR